MPLTRARLEQIRIQLHAKLVAKHPGWAAHVAFLERYGKEVKIAREAPTPLPEGLTPATMTGPQRTAFIAQLKAALDPDDRAAVDEVMP